MTTNTDTTTPTVDTKTTPAVEPTAKSSEKKTKSSKPSANIGKSISHFLYRFHFVLFVVVVIGGIAAVIFLLNQVLITASDTSDAPLSSSGAFDQSTIDQLGDLDDSAAQSEFRLPSGRTNPFTE